MGADLARAAEGAREAEAAGYDGVWSAETSHDPFLPLMLAAEHTSRIELGTGITVAFARNPMTLANIGYDLQLYSRRQRVWEARLGGADTARELVAQHLGM